MSALDLLPVHGVVLAGGRSLRMGQDKAMLMVGRRPMIEVAVERLRQFCSETSIAGNRDDLARFASILHESRIAFGPAAGIEAGLLASASSWVLFTPVDCPLTSAELLRRWVAAIIDQNAASVRLSFLSVQGEAQPAFCLLHRDCLPALSATLDAGEHKLVAILKRVAEHLGPASLSVVPVEELAPEQGTKELQRLFSNINTPADLLSLASPHNEAVRV